MLCTQYVMLWPLCVVKMCHQRHSQTALLCILSCQADAGHVGIGAKLADYQGNVPGVWRAWWWGLVHWWLCSLRAQFNCTAVWLLQSSYSKAAPNFCATVTTVVKYKHKLVGWELLSLGGQWPSFAGMHVSAHISLKLFQLEENN